MIGAWVTHALVYLIVCTACSFVWVLLGGGSLEELRGFVRTPGDAVTASFWPVWIWLGWGVGVAIHLAVVVGTMLNPSYWHGRVRRARQLRADGAGAAEAALGSAVPERPARRGSATERRDRRHRDRRPRRDRVAVVFVDICGSTARNEHLGDETWTGVLARHRATVRSRAEPHGGTEVGTQGDGCLLRFADPAGAVRAAVDLQRALAHDRARDGDDAVPRVRVGIHTGEAVRDGGDVLGRTVNVAARVTDAAAADEIMVTEPVLDAATAEGIDLTVADRGLVELKGIARPRHLLALGWEPPEGDGDGPVPAPPTSADPTGPSTTT